MRSLQIRSSLALVSALLLLATACGNDDTGGTTTPISPNNNAMEDMKPSVDMKMAEPDMKPSVDMKMPEEDMGAEEVDMGPMDPMISGNWVLRTLDDEGMPEDSVVTFMLMHQPGAPTVSGTYELAGGGETGDVEGTFLSDELELSWETSQSVNPYLFLGDTFSPTTIEGDYTDPANAGISVDAVLEREQ